MAIEDIRPKWHERFSGMVESCWQHHGPCGHLTFKLAYNLEAKTWMILAAPVFQEVLGGEDDGKKVWTGFVFHLDKFMHEDGIYVQNFAASSICSKCSPVPRLMLAGKYRTHRIYLQVYLEPIPESSAVEIIDTINEKIIDKEQEDDDTGTNPQQTERGNEDTEPGERHTPGLPGETPTD